MPVQLGVRLRMGIGLLLSWMAMVTIVESIRRRKAIQDDNFMDMSAMWLRPQYCLLGLAEAFTTIRQTKFLYTIAPKSMSSVATTLLLLGIVVTTWLSDVVVNGI
ncbi:hypothetical protein SLE2022_307880 [Rubroshorea leprosula]